MIYFDVTKSGRARHQSGLMRVSARLREELGARATWVVWRDGWRQAQDEKPVSLSPDDWLFTPELFSETERPGFWQFLRTRPCRTAAIFHDAIPLKLPHLTWPQSVARHPEYLKMLAEFDCIAAVSRASAQELVGFWKWQEVQPRAHVTTLSLGSDAVDQVRVTADVEDRRDREPLLLCLGIVEPRKNQELLLRVAERLIGKGVRFQLHWVGRVNPHFGKPLAGQLRAAARRYPQLHFSEALSDQRVKDLWTRASASVFPTLAEGCGLPLLESLWMGVPCVCSDLPVLRENADAGGCVPVRGYRVSDWMDVLERVLTDQAFTGGLARAARTRALPTWKAASEDLLALLA